MRFKGFTVFLLFSLFFITSCEKSQNYSQTFELDNLWIKNKPLVFEMEVEDTVSRFNADFILRNNDDYPYQNINFFTNVSLDGNAISRDTLSYYVAEVDGTWIGDGLGDLKSLRLVFKENFRFTKKGNYKFQVFHAMRIDSLVGIEDLSILIKNINE